VSSDFHDLWKLFYDWQTIAAGILAIVAALIGGFFVYWVGVKQIRALQEQNADLKRAEQRRLARETLSTARMLDASLQVIAENIEGAREWSGAQPRSGHVDQEMANSVRQTLGEHRLSYLRDKMGILDPEIAVPLIRLEATLDRFRAEKGETHAGGLTDRLKEFSVLVQRIRDLAGGEIARTRAILSPDELAQK